MTTNPLLLEGFTHREVQSGGCRIHLIDAGSGPAVVLCHGFPEFWLSWRHQIPALVAAGYRVLALDMRGHGGSDAPAEVADYSVLHTVGDVIAVLDDLEIDRAVIVGHDAGTTTAYHTALMRPDRIVGVAGLSVPYIPRGPVSLLTGLRQVAPPDFYMLYFQQPGLAEQEFERDVAETLRRILYANSGMCPAAPIVMRAIDGALLPNLPSAPGSIDFISNEDFAEYHNTFRRTGFRGGLNGYRVFDLNWALTAPWNGMGLPVPSLYIGGELDTVLTFPGFRDAAVQMDRAMFLESAGHWIHAEKPAEVNAALLAFIASCQHEAG
jgi:pimeloyl-ACP methyl ester carboxylesterase